MERAPVAVAMSGGVDSSVAAALLARSGREVIGLTMRLGGAGEEAEDAALAARRVAGRLGIPHRVLDLGEEFRRLVLDGFAEEYARGRTPSPCVRCNSLLKFGVLLDRARVLGAETLATGHYAILDEEARSGRALLRRAADRARDQSYFLFDLSEEQRRGAELPLGEMTKEEVRATAADLGLDVAGRPDSMDLCFLRRGEDYRKFLSRERGAGGGEPGEIVSVRGEVLGRHDGIAGFTVGQRRGLGLAAGRPLYVVRVEAASRRVVVGEERDLDSRSCSLERVRWIPFDRPVGPLRAIVKIRSSHAGASASIEDRGDGTATVAFDEPQRAIAPGQAAVAYDGDLVLGGGWIAEAGPA